MPWRTGSTPFFNRARPTHHNPIGSNTLPQFALFVPLLGLCLVVVGGCNKPTRPLRAADIHAITQEFVAAAVSTGVSATDLRSYAHASDQDRYSSDELDITIRPRIGDPSGATARALPRFWTMSSRLTG